MFTRFRAALVALVFLISSLVFAPRVSAHTTGTFHYNAACSTGNPTYNAQANIVRPASGAGSFKAVRANVTVRDLYPCYTAAGSNGGFSLVNVANGARWVGSSETQLVQFGYAMQECTGAYCQGGFTSGIQDWWYTLYDDSSHGGFGVIFRADWVDFGGDGNDPSDRPQAGTNYQLSITYETTPCTCWRLRIWNDVGQTSWHDINRTSGSSGYFTNLNWGFEVWNDASAFGHLGSTPTINLTPLQYLNSNGTIWSTANGDVNDCHWQVHGPYPAPDHWGSEHCDVTTPGPSGNTIVDGWTANHN